jgi:hypothetical protein
MHLLDRYLKAVRHSLLLTSGARRDDIIKELDEHLRSEMEEREVALGRPLDEAEQEEILTRYGHPWLVASRYGGSQGTLALGSVLIGPEVFPYYLAILCLNLAVTVGICLVFDLVALAGGTPMSRVVQWSVQWPGIALPILVQLAVVTVIFIGVETWKRRFMNRLEGGVLNLRRSSPPSPHRRRTVIGIVIWSVALLWWAFVPLQPALLFGRAVTDLRLGLAWTPLFAPILFLLAAGIVQRAIFLARPDLTWFHTGMRLTINVLALVFLYGLRSSGDFVVVAGTAADAVRAQHQAQSFNAAILWGFLSWIWIYLAVNVLAHGVSAVKQLRRWQRGRGSATVEDRAQASG